MRAVNSSSPSVRNTPSETPVTVTAIRPHASLAAGVCVFGRLHEDEEARWDGARPRRDRIVRFDLDRDVAARVNPPIQESVLTTFGYLRDLVRESGKVLAPLLAVELLARREHSEVELTRKLQVRGYTAEAIAHAVGRVQERNYQNDYRFALSWVRSRMSGNGTSRTALFAGLARRGVDRATAERAVREYETENPDCFSRALRAAVEALDEDDESKVIRKLARRGFDVVEIKKSYG